MCPCPNVTFILFLSKQCSDKQNKLKNHRGYGWKTVIDLEAESLFFLLSTVSIKIRCQSTQQIRRTIDHDSVSVYSVRTGSEQEKTGAKYNKPIKRLSTVIAPVRFTFSHVQMRCSVHLSLHLCATKLSKSSNNHQPITPSVNRQKEHATSSSNFLLVLHFKAYWKS